MYLTVAKIGDFTLLLQIPFKFVLDCANYGTAKQNYTMNIERPILNLDEAAFFLHLSRRSVNNLIKRGLLKSSKLGGARRVRKTDLEDCLRKLTK